MKVIESDGVGPSAARNLAIARAQAELIAFLDADDIWRPGKLAAQLAFHARQPELAFSFTDYLHVDMSGASHGTCFDYWKPTWLARDTGAYVSIPDAEHRLLGCNVVGTSTVVASRNALQNANGFVHHLRSAEDWLLWLNLAHAGGVAASCAVTMDYLMRPNSVSKNQAPRIAAMRKIVARYKDDEGAAARQAWRQAMARIDRAQAEYSRETGEYLRAARHHIASFLRWPERRTARAAVSDLISAMHVNGH